MDDLATNDVDVDNAVIEDANVTLTCFLETDRFVQAKSEELNKWKLFDAYEEVEDTGKSYINGRWVCTEKFDDKGLRLKAIFVAKGFQEKSVIQSDSRTGNKECMRILFVVISQNSWTLNSIDIRSAFLQGSPITRDIYLKPPPESNSKNVLWKLKKCIYGLNDAARMWYFAVLDELTTLFCVRLTSDYAVFMWYLNDELCGVMELHVDDILWSGTPSFQEKVIKPFCDKFMIGSAASTSVSHMVHLGIRISQSEDGIFIDQDEYVQEINSIPISRASKLKKQHQCDGSEATLYRKLVGKLNWVSTQTRPDIAFSVCLLSSSMSKPKIDDLMLANKTLNYLKNNPLPVRYPKLGKDISLYGYSDASLANLPSGRSAIGYVVFAVSNNGQVSAPIAWKSNSTKRVVRSTLAAETSALTDCLDCAFCLSSVFGEILFRVRSLPTVPIFAFTDNQSLVDNAHSTTMPKEHRLRVDMAIVKEMIDKNELQKLIHVESEDQVADCLTKKGANPTKISKVFEDGRLL